MNDSIAIHWSIDDVRELRPDLTDAQAIEVLRQILAEHDAEIGINWQVIGFHADALFPKGGAI